MITQDYVARQQYKAHRNSLAKQNAPGTKVKALTFRCVPIYGVLANCIYYEATINGKTVKNQSIMVVQDWIEEKTRMNENVCC